MFNPMIGQIVMALAVIACIGSLLGWQFTMGTTAKTASDDRMFPSVFSRLNGMGAPVMGMIILCGVQTLFAFSTISPTLAEQFSALVNLSVVTNVLPYILALSALSVMMKGAKIADSKFRMNLFITTVGMLYSAYAIYSAGMEAVFGGMIAMVVAFIIWAFISPRFVSLDKTKGETK